MPPWTDAAGRLGPSAVPKWQPPAVKPRAMNVPDETKTAALARRLVARTVRATPAAARRVPEAIAALQANRPKVLVERVRRVAPGAEAAPPVAAVEPLVAPAEVQQAEAPAVLVVPAVVVPVVVPVVAPAAAPAAVVAVVPAVPVVRAVPAVRAVPVVPAARVVPAVPAEKANKRYP